MKTRHIITINPKYESFRPQIEAMIRGGMPVGAEIIYKGRNTLYATRLGDTTAVVKQFRRPNIVNAYVYTTLRESKAARSYLNAMRMKDLGFLTPEPIAYGETRRGLRLEQSCYISVGLEGATEMRHWEDFPFADTLLPAFATEIWKLHKAGVWHKDFSPGNILFTGDARTGYRFHYVDLNRMEFGVRDPRKLMSMFRSINLDPAQTEKLARLYAEVSGLNADEVSREALARLQGYFAERERKRKFKKLVHPRG